MRKSSSFLTDCEFHWEFSSVRVSNFTCPCNSFCCAGQFGIIASSVLTANKTATCRRHVIKACYERRDSGNITWKCNLAFLPSYLNYPKSLCLQDVFEVSRSDKTFEKLSRSAPVSRQRWIRSFHVVEGTRLAITSTKMKNICAKRIKPLFVVVEYANLWRCCRLVSAKHIHRAWFSCLDGDLEVWTWY